MGGGGKGRVKGRGVPVGGEVLTNERTGTDHVI